MVGHGSLPARQARVPDRQVPTVDCDGYERIVRSALSGPLGTVSTMQPRPWSDHLPPDSDFGVEDLTARASLPAAWSDVWTADPSAPLIYDLGTGTEARWVTAGEFEERTRLAALRLMRLGLKAGDRVLTCVGSSLEAAIAYVAVLRTGVLVVVPANSAYTARELAHIVRDVRPAAAVVDDPDRSRWIAESSSAPIVVLSHDLRVVGGTGSRAGGSDIGRTASAGPDPGGHGSLDDVLNEAAPGDAALIAYTSGTTGAPKGAVLTHANLLANSESVAMTWRWRPEDRLVHALPIFHGHGLCVALFTTLLRGSSAVILPRFDVDGVLDACQEQRATLFFGVPTMYHRLAESSRVGELSRLRLAVSGSAPLAAHLHERICELGRTVVLERYGMTETLMTLSNPYDGDRRPGTVGFPFPGVDAQFDGEEILVRGPTVFNGYWERPAATAERVVGGWFHTGDLGVVDDGYVRILGRATDVILSGGFNVYPAEVEDVILTHPAVVEVAVTGTPSEEWGEVVTAWVVADGQAPSADELLAFVADQLVAYKRPRLVRFVEALPRNAMGKVRRVDLR
jgi:malonyl-CoA/methylmalonyl-CoA synthetase